MKARMLLLATLALTPIAVYAHDDAHKGMMPGMMHGTTPGKAGKVDFACLQPGHFEAGMLGKVSVK